MHIPNIDTSKVLFPSYGRETGSRMLKSRGCRGGIHLFQLKRIPSKRRGSLAQSRGCSLPAAMEEKFLKQTLHFGRRSYTGSGMGLTSVGVRYEGGD